MRLFSDVGICSTVPYPPEAEELPQWSKRERQGQFFHIVWIPDPSNDFDYCSNRMSGITLCFYDHDLRNFANLPETVKTFPTYYIYIKLNVTSTLNFIPPTRDFNVKHALSCFRSGRWVTDLQTRNNFHLESTLQEYQTL